MQDLLLEHFDTFLKAVDSWGTEAQISMVIEECSELILAISKYKRDPNKENINHITEEMADVYIMLAQLDLIINEPKILKDWIDYKLSRLKERLSG